MFHQPSERRAGGLPEVASFFFREMHVPFVPEMSVFPFSHPRLFIPLACELACGCAPNPPAGPFS